MVGTQRGWHCDIVSCQVGLCQVLQDRPICACWRLRGTCSRGGWVEAAERPARHCVHGSVTVCMARQRVRGMGGGCRRRREGGQGRRRRRASRPGSASVNGNERILSIDSRGPAIDRSLGDTQRGKGALNFSHCRAVLHQSQPKPPCTKKFSHLC